MNSRFQSLMGKPQYRRDEVTNNNCSQELRGPATVSSAEPKFSTNTSQDSHPRECCHPWWAGSYYINQGHGDNHPQAYPV